MDLFVLDYKEKDTSNRGRIIYFGWTRGETGEGEGSEENWEGPGPSRVPSKRDLLKG